MRFKEFYKKFRIWQVEGPQFVVKDNNAIHQCHCCGNNFNGNFCPVCGQNKDTYRLTWAAFGREALNVWGLGNRSMPYSLWQLMFRSGYFIGDYINGKRQISFPPVKMLVIMGLFSALLQFLFEKPNPILPSADTNDPTFLNLFFNWCNNANQGWAMLIMCSFLIIPTWALFHNAPRHKHHTLPEGFFIQVFMAILMIIIAIFDVLLYDLSWFIGIFFYYVVYRQLFGYKPWSTIWRMALGALTAFMTFFILALMTHAIYEEEIYKNMGIIGVVKYVLIGVLINSIPLIIGHTIDHWHNKTATSNTTNDETAPEETATSQEPTITKKDNEEVKNEENENKDKK